MLRSDVHRTTLRLLNHNLGAGESCSRGGEPQAIIGDTHDTTTLPDIGVPLSMELKRPLSMRQPHSPDGSPR
jgi:hypothetical protein